MAKLTETTNDQLKEPKRRGRPPGSKNKSVLGGNGNGLHITAAHEPLPGDLYQIATQHPELAYAATANLPPMTISQTFTSQPPFVSMPMPPVAPAAEPQPLKIALIGTAPSSRMLAPYADNSWKIWACSPGNMNILPRVDAWFEIHVSLLWPENRHYGEPYLAWLSQQKFPIYMQDNRYLKQAIPLPVDDLINEFGPYFFTSSFAWMMAMAMKEGAKEIALYGIDMASRDEYILQRPGAYHFFQEARKRGIKMSAPYESDIMQPPALYGYSEGTPIGRKTIARKIEINERIKALDAEIQQKTHQKIYLEGAREDCDYFESIWGGVQNNPHPGSIGS